MDMRVEICADVAPAAAWAVVGEEFGQISQWCSAIRASSMGGPPAVGQTRACQIAGFGPIAAGTIRERLTSYSPESMSLSYAAVDGMPRFVRRAVSSWSVRPLHGGRCVVSIHATLTLRTAVRPLAPLIRWRMRADTRRVLQDLRYRIETGGARPANAASVAEAAP